jgi:alkanesulfonate monooxygenase SsuD/methylene tetrahydromethanopterin reductase-like flavin-dependent oxidoreductase (luciferase family)
MQVDFGIWDHFERRPGLTVERQYQEKIRLLQEAERLGFTGYHVAEHHLTPLDLAPSPNVFLAALAQATSRLRVGTIVHILPLYHPVRLVQELCMLDNLSGGRLDFGVGRGARAVEHEWFGVDPAEAAARNEEVLRIVVSAMSSGNLAYEGRFYRIPDAPLALTPVQRPYPEIWYAGTPEFPGRRGLHFVTRTSQAVARYWQLWDETRGRGGHLNPQAAAPRVGTTKHVVVRETDAEARAVAARAWRAFSRNWAATSLRTPDGRVTPEQSADFEAVLAEGERLLVGTPRTLRAYLDGVVEQFQDRPGFYFAPAVQWGDITFEEALQTIELLASEVMPAFRPSAVGR